MADIVYALILLVGVPALLALATGWTRSFAELLWLLTIRPATISAAVLATLVLVSVPLRAIFGLAPAGPLSFSFALIAVPFAAVRLGNYLAYCWRSEEHHALGWKHFIFAAKSLDQRRAYEAPPNQQ